MESVDSSPDYVKTTSRVDAKKHNSPEGSECDDNISISSSTGKSGIKGPCAPKLKNNGIKYRSSNKKALKNFGGVRSFRRRAKARLVQSPDFDDAAASYTGSSVNSSAASPHYLKATSSSQGKKMHSHLSPRHSESPFSSSDRNSSPLLQSKLGSPKQTLSRTSSIRNVRFLVKKTSFKPRRTALNYSKASEDVSLDRATYSSTVKDLKFPEPVEIHHGGTESEKLSAMQVCRYHHCSLHGHCHGGLDPVPQPKRLLYRRRWSLKKQRSMKPKTEQTDYRKKEIQKSRMGAAVEPSDQESISNGVAFSGVENKNAVDSPAEIYSQNDAELFGDGHGSNHELHLLEVAFGETSFPERSYQDSLSILRKYSFEEEGFGGSSFGPTDRCSRCSCHIQGQVTSTPRKADADLSLSKSTSSVPDNGYGTQIPQNGDADVLDTSSSFDEPKEQVGDHIEDDSTLTCANEASSDERPASPVTVEETEIKSVSYSPSDSQTTSHFNSDEEGDVKTESTPDGDSKIDEAMQDTVADSPPQSGGKLQFSKQRHISMWHLIHQHMSSSKGAESPEKPLQGADGESPTDDTSMPVAKRISASDRDLSDSHVGEGKIEPEIQDIELRKLFAIKLVREAIEKILLPEVQDQASDDQSITSESTPQPELVEKNQSQVFDQEDNGDNDADIGKANVSSNAMEKSHMTGDASRPANKKTVEKVMSKSENKAPKHWSNLKKWILLQRFIRALEKVRKFNPRKPQLLPLNPDPEAEKVNLRPQTVDGRKNAEEWMLDYALRQAVNQLAPTQKKKVALLVKAFETVVPPQEDVHFRIPRLNDNGVDISSTSNKGYEPISEDPVSAKGQPSSTAQSSSLDDNEKSRALENALGPGSHSDAVNQEKFIANGTEREGMRKLQGLEEGAASDCVERKVKDGGDANVQVDMKNHIKMWHMIYQHVVSGIAEKVGSQLLDGAEDDDGEENKSPAIKNVSYSNEFPKSRDESNNLRSGFTKSDALKLIKDAVDEILLDDSSDTQSVTSETIPDLDILERNLSETEGQNTLTKVESVSKKEGEKAESQVERKIELSKSKNWSKVKRLMLLKRSIKALEKARNLKTQTRQLLPQVPDPQPQKIDLRRQMMDERTKAEEWMLDYAVQHIVTKLTPARKRRVSMLVEAFEAVVPFPDT